MQYPEIPAVPPPLTPEGLADGIGATAREAEARRDRAAAAWEYLEGRGHYSADAVFNEIDLWCFPLEDFQRAQAIAAGTAPRPDDATQVP